MLWELQFTSQREEKWKLWSIREDYASIFLSESLYKFSPGNHLYSYQGYNYIFTVSSSLISFRILVSVNKETGEEKDVYFHYFYSKTQ